MNRKIFLPTKSSIVMEFILLTEMPIEGSDLAKFMVPSEVVGRALIPTGGCFWKANKYGYSNLVPISFGVVSAILETPIVVRAFAIANYGTKEVFTIVKIEPELILKTGTYPQFGKNEFTFLSEPILFNNICVAELCDKSS